MNEDKTLRDIYNHIVSKHPDFAAKNLNEPIIQKLDSHFKQKFDYYYIKDQTCELSALCEKYGSDKGENTKSIKPYPWPSHSYADFYSRLFGHCRNSIRKVFECGLGTNNPQIRSNMTTNGQPGASLRVWRDYFPNAIIYGADIDKDILFTDNRINTFHVDQTDSNSISIMWQNINDSDFDLIIDDGLHTFQAGITLFEASHSKLAKFGIYIIEDVTQNDLISYINYFRKSNFKVDYACLKRNTAKLNDNNLVIIRK